MARSYNSWIFFLDLLVKHQLRYVTLSPDHGEMYLIPPYMITLVSTLWIKEGHLVFFLRYSGFLHKENKTDHQI